MTKEDQIKEVMGLVEDYAYEYRDFCQGLPSDITSISASIEAKLRELLQGIGDSEKAKSE